MDDRLLDLLEQWEDAAAAGNQPDPLQLAAGDQQLAERLKRQIAALKRVAWIVAPQPPAEELHLPTVQSFSSSLLTPDNLTLKTLKANLANAEIISSAKLKDLLKSHDVRTAHQLAGLLLERDLVTRFQLRSIANGKTRGLKLGRYVILDKIGEGGMGQVFKARHSKMGRIVALKVLPRSAMSKAQGIERFNQEMKVAAKLRHENIVTAYDADDAEGLHFFVMEYVEGRDLNSLVRRDGPLSVGMAADCLLQAALGLEYAHGVGLVHRDVKPANLLLDQQGVVKILDMGIARIQTEDDKTGLTQNGAVMGTVDYMAPEQAIDAKTVTAQADIYSLGCSLYFVLTGRPPFGGETLMVKLLGHRELPPPSLLRIRSDVPPALESIYQKCMAKSPADRYASISELIADLRRVRPQLSDAPPPQLLGDAETAQDTEPTNFQETQPFAKPVGPAMPLATPPLTTKTRQKTRPSRGAPFYASLLGIALMMCAAAYSARGLFVSPAPSPGSLLVEVNRDALAAHLRDYQLTLVNQQTQQQTPITLQNAQQIASLPPGDYEFAPDDNDLLMIDVRKFTIRSDAQSRVRITWKQEPAATEVAQPTKPAPPIAKLPFNYVEAKQYQASWASYLDVPETSVNSVGIQFRVIPPGQFTMGSPSDQPYRRPDETEHPVRISRPYLMSDTEVTQAQWEAVMGTTPWSADKTIPVSPEMPATPVTWDEANEFCRKLSEQEQKTYRLPTEAEWEFACRAGADTPYFFGTDRDRVGNYAWYRQNCFVANEKYPHPVRQKVPNAFGLYDMPGGVWEWCSDWYGQDYYRSSPEVDPQGPKFGADHVRRGGSWYYGEDVARSAARSVDDAKSPFYVGGFRIVEAFPNVPAQLPPPKTTPAAEPVPPAKEYALQFDGALDYVQLPYKFDLKAPWTIEVVATVPTAKLERGASVFGTTERGGLGLEFREDPISGKLTAGFLIHSKKLNSYLKKHTDQIPEPGKLVNLTVVADADVIRFFVEGKLAGEIGIEETDRNYNAIDAVLAASPSNQVGRPVPIDFPYPGAIQQFRISQTARFHDDFSPRYKFDSDAQTYALYRFQEGAGAQLADSSGNGRHGVIQSNPKWEPAVQPNPPPPGYALDFDGVDDYVELPFGYSGETPITVEVVLPVPNDPVSHGAVFGNTEYSGFGLDVESLPEPGMSSTKAVIRSLSQNKYAPIGETPLPAAGTLVNLTVVITPQECRYYVDGRQFGKLNIPVSDRKQNQLHFLVGASANNAPGEPPFDFPLRGKIQQVRVSLTERYASDFVPQYAFEPDDQTFAVYQFREGSGTILRDTSGNARHGTIYGNPKWEPVGEPPAKISLKNGLDFDGVDDRVVIPVTDNLTAGPLTIEYFVEPTSGGNVSMYMARAIGQGATRTVSNTPDARIHAIHNNVNVDIRSISHPPAGWFHVAAVFDDVPQVFINGAAAEAAPTHANDPRRNPDPDSIVLGGTSGHMFRGKLGPVRISKTIRYRENFTPPAELTNDADTYALYKFAEGAGAKLLDSSGHDRHGNIEGDPQWLRVTTAQTSAAPVVDAADGKWIDLLPLFRLPANVIQGEWELSDGALTCQAAENGRLYVPYAVTGSYKVAVEFTRTAGNDALALRLPTVRSCFEFAVGAFDNKHSGIRDVGNVNLSQMPRPTTAVNDDVKLENSKRYRLEVDVRFPSPANIAVSGTLDGQPLANWSGQPELLSGSLAACLPEVRMLGLICNESDFTIHKLEIMLQDDAQGRRLGDVWNNEFYAVDDTPAPQYLQHCKQWNGRYYLFGQGAMPLPFAQDVAHLYRARLVTISSSEEEEFIAANMPQKTCWTSAWRSAGDETWRDDRNRPLHYIGNWLPAPAGRTPSDELFAVMTGIQAAPDGSFVRRWTDASAANLKIFPVYEWGVEEHSDPDRRAAEYVLSIGGKVRINDEHKVGTTPEIKDVTQLPQTPFRLTHVDLTNIRQITDEGLAAFRGTTNLRRLSLVWAGRISPEGLANFSANQRIGMLDLWGTKLTADAFPMLDTMNEIVDFRFGFNPLNDADMNYFRTYGGLKTLQCVMLSGTEIGDDGIACLVGADRLRQLNLDNTKMTDECFETFRKLPELRNIHLLETGVTAEGVAAFKKERPGCQIFWDGAPNG
ncbi:protein kinase domain-containing protein [Blastopirellula marina]|uniref:non-specific serine/threonine protein kinase n=1 Tax=Blastopirellula marina TaxID=124 RepID=A0A2S8GNJ3_9BACT|nr:SUMF1/EgtB/PvdO family nonheme iron enzyme [Blastopirellula marina]PQO45995.1 hypothetical protein C5Y93_12165 [Blastopirellula marina]